MFSFYEQKESTSKISGMIHKVDAVNKYEHVKYQIKKKEKESQKHSWG